jgi:hypothetical protein
MGFRTDSSSGAASKRGEIALMKELAVGDRPLDETGGGICTMVVTLEVATL